MPGRDGDGRSAFSYADLNAATRSPSVLPAAATGTNRLQVAHGVPGRERTASSRKNTGSSVRLVQRVMPIVERGEADDPERAVVVAGECRSHRRGSRDCPQRHPLGIAQIPERINTVSTGTPRLAPPDEEGRRPGSGHLLDCRTRWATDHARCPPKASEFAIRNDHVNSVNSTTRQRQHDRDGAPVLKTASDCGADPHSAGPAHRRSIFRRQPMSMSRPVATKARRCCRRLR